jgi:hypothetical protein
VSASVTASASASLFISLFPARPDGNTLGEAPGRAFARAFNFQGEQHLIAQPDVCFNSSLSLGTDERLGQLMGEGDER